ncbi:helix-turn-helix domain-containing protein [Bizionia sediminis]|uniref:Helix-turn-helix domain-containing protein n=1 Tax=Bizionia sediminis TaxID=1737064 RepID=A0ABW5KRJ9_9FLAO
MALQNIVSYKYRDIFSLNIVDFQKACVVHKPEQVQSYNVYWITDGKGVYNIDFKGYEFEGEVLFFLTPGQVFSVAHEKIKSAYKLSFDRDFYCIQTHDKEVSCNGVLFNNVYETPFVKPSEKESLKLTTILEGLIEEFQNNQIAQHDMLQAYLKQFIVNAVRIKKETGIIKTDADTKLFKDFSLLVEQNFKTHHSVTEYAKRLGLSPKSLTKHLQLIGASTPSQVIKKRLVLEAKRQLVYSDASVKQIAFNLGFTDPAYFSRFFTKATSQSPLQYKKDFKNT